MNRKVNDKVSGLIRIVSTADGELVGRTRLQKTAFLLELAGLGSGFDFQYKHYGPYSETLAQAASIAPFFWNFKEEKRQSNWGGTYSVFRTNEKFEDVGDDAYRQIILMAKNADPIVLELAATAAYLAVEGNPDPWSETARRKPEKISGGRLDRAKELYSQFKKIPTPNPLPDL